MSSNKTHRKKAREAAFLTLFATAFDKTAELEGCDKEALQQLTVELLETEDSSYTDLLVQGVKENELRLDAAYIPFLGKGWRPERLSRVSRILLRLAVFELTQGQDIEPEIAVFESVELCKKYADPKEVGFLNGVLRSFLRDKEGQA